MTFQKQNKKSQQGQTIIETLAAIFILVTSLTVGLGLAVNILSNSQNGIFEVEGMNLAREGIELTRMMRDSNWLAGDAVGGSAGLVTCSDVSSLCYSHVFTGPVTGGSSTQNNFDLSISGIGSTQVCDHTSTNCSRSIYITKNINNWDLSNPANFYAVGTATTANYGVHYDPVTRMWDNGLPSGCSTEASCPPTFLRKIKLKRVNIAPFTNSNSNWETVVNVYVVWSGKRCNNTLLNQDPELLNTNCKIVLEERLSNWKDYK
ncbi:MAG: hypothetical protein KW804_02650 [Candidatus Doudnabacteria bacterium]|nr:hypothetical protein [Candidatus Doudnabacteria bacterium]